MVFPMVTEITLKGKIFFQCGICNLKYTDRKTAEACESWCKKHPGTCDPRISEKAVI